MSSFPVRTLILGGGPAGLYFALLLKKERPYADITLLERNHPGDTFGWGVVFSDQTLGHLMDADPVSAHIINAAFNHWDDIEIRFKGTRSRSTGHGFIGIGRKKLLNILQDRCRELGVKLVFDHEVRDIEATIREYSPDLVIAADGVGSRVRQLYRASYQPDIDVRRNRFVWLGTRAKYDAFTFDFQETPHGWFQAHIYQFDDQMSTFIVETPQAVWEASGLKDLSKQANIEFCEELFRDVLGGEKLISNAAHLHGSDIWSQFPRIKTKEWVYWGDYGGNPVPVVLMGDAAHTAHYSIGSGTKLALEDAIALMAALRQMQTLEQALERYTAERSTEVLKLQNAARNSTEWFENVARYAQLPPEQFAYSLLTRSQRISHENLRQRDSAYLNTIETWLTQQSGGPPTALPPMLMPYTLRGVTLGNRIVMSPMAVYSAVNGVPNDFHLVHLGARALGGAGLIFTEMTCVTPQGRITPGCAGLWNDEQQRAWQRIVTFIHGSSPAKVAIQLGHAGAKGSTRRAWDGGDLPLKVPDEPNWPLLSASPQQYLPGISQTASAITRSEMDEVRGAFVDAARRAAAADFDWLELHCAHGYLLSSFISPLTNRRTDEYGGSLPNRLRYPLEVFRALREVWPTERPISVRISAHDWVDGGITPDDAVEIARHFKAAGADMIDCSSGQVSKAEAPVYGRMYQTPFADRVRNEAGIPTIAVGNIFEADHVNSIIASGRADLCALGRPAPGRSVLDAARSRQAGLRRAILAQTVFSGQAAIRAQSGAREGVERCANRTDCQPQPPANRTGGWGVNGEGQALSGLHAVVTGGGSGIGAAVAQRLAQQGARLTLMGRNLARLEAQAAKLGAAFEGLDVTDEGSVTAAFEAARQASGPIRILINNAGQASSASALRTDLALWRRMVDVNLTGTWLCTRAALPDLLEQGGRIVNVASTAGLVGYAYVSAYVAAKHGVIGLTRALALELAQRGVTVNAVCPGYTDTPLLAEAVENIVSKTGRSPAEAVSSLSRSNPQGRLVQPGEVADAVAWLCSPGASSITGQALAVAGGEVMTG